MGRRLNWISPFVFLAHDLEEALQADRMNVAADAVARRLPAPLKSPMSRARYSRRGMTAFAFGALGAQCLLTRTARSGPRGARLLRSSLVVRLVNGVMHIGGSVALRRYVPGTATAPAIVLAAWLQLRAGRDRGAHIQRA